MAAEAPNSFRDPFWTGLASSTEQKLGLPDGLLVSILTNGERSNANQTSEAGAKTPFQIIPSTREAALKKYGIDPYLSPQNAAEVAGLLLKDSLQRNGNDPAAAAAEYHGGTDRANWGPRTKAYVQRVMDGIQQASASVGVVPPARTGPSTFDRVKAQMDAEQAPSKLAAVYQAYKSGQMTPDETQQFEADVRSGAMMLPQGGTLNGGSPGVGGATRAAAGQGAPVPAGVLSAFARGDMTPQEMTDFEHDVRAGTVTLPQGVDADTLFGTPDKPKGVMERIAAIPGNVMEAITGNGRRVAETEALPDWMRLPELSGMGVNAGTSVLAPLKAAIGSQLAGPDEAAQIIQANFPNVQLRRDEAGNIIFKSGMDGREYAMKPGFRLSDIGRALTGVAAFTPAGRATTVLGAGGRAALTQAAIEGTQAATGGEFNTGDVALAGGLGAAGPVAARIASAAGQGVKTVANRVLGREAPALETAGQVAATAQPAAAQPVVAAPIAEPTVSQVASTARDAAKGGMGSAKAQQELAAMAAPDAAKTAAAERLGVQDYLQPDHVTTNDAFRQVVGVIKSNPTLELSQAEKVGLEKVAERANNLVDEIGGTTDLSTLNSTLKSRMQATHAELGAAEDQAWNKLREAIPKTEPTPAENTLAFLRQQAEDLGGEQNLSAFEKKLLAKLSPKQGAVVDAPAPSAAAEAEAANQRGLMVGQGPRAATPAAPVAREVVQPSYALVDNLRREAGRKSQMAGAFSDADTGLAKKLYGLLSKDQEAVATQLGHSETVDLAKALTTQRKGMEDDLAALFGKRLDGSMTGDLRASMKAAANGDTSGLVALLKATPDNMKQQVVASGVASVFRNQATRGELNFTSYAKWFENLQRNKQAYTAVMSNLPAPARQQLADLALVSKGISDSLSARIKTGLRSSVLEEMAAPDTLASRLYGLATHAGKGLAADAVGGHGAGLAMGLFSALKGGAKPNAVKAVDELLMSPEFAKLARAGSQPSPAEVKALAQSRSFSKFVRAIGSPRELSNREKFILASLQAAKTQQGGGNARR